MTGYASGTLAEARAFSAVELVDHFRAKTGQELVRSNMSDGVFDLLEPSESADSADYGTFTIFVVRSGEAAYPEILLGSEDGKALQLDARGINWQDVGDGLFQAARQYGKNIFLLWYGWRGIGQTDATWDRLDTILTDLVESTRAHGPLRPPRSQRGDAVVPDTQQPEGRQAEAVTADAATADTPLDDTQRLADILAELVVEVRPVRASQFHH